VTSGEGAVGAWEGGEGGREGGGLLVTLARLSSLLGGRHIVLQGEGREGEGMTHSLGDDDDQHHQQQQQQPEEEHQ